MKHGGFSVRDFPNEINELDLKPEEERIFVHLSLLCEKMICFGSCGEKEISSGVEIVNFAYTVAYVTLSSNHMRIDDSVLPINHKWRKLVRIVAMPSFHRKEHGRSDVTMVENNKKF